MSVEGDRLLRARGPKQFQTNLRPTSPDTVLGIVYDHLDAVLNNDTGGKFWSLEREKRFIPGNPDGKYIRGRCNYKVAQLTGIVSIHAAATRYGELGTSLVMSFEDNLAWMPNAEHITGSTMQDIALLIQRHYGPRRWVLIVGGWLNFCGFQTAAALDEPEPDRPPPVGLVEPEWPAPGRELLRRRRFAFLSSGTIMEIARAIEQFFETPARSDWRAKWTWPPGGTAVTIVWNCERQRHAEARPLSPIGEELLRGKAGSLEPAKLDVQYRYVLTIATEFQPQGKSTIAVSLEEAIDPRNRYNHLDVLPQSFMREEAEILGQLQRALAFAGDTE